MAEITGRIHSFESFGTLDGPGVRYIVFLQGCALRCSYCHNPDTWDVKGGQEFTVSEVMQKIISCRSYIKSGGVTLSGGEPLLQARFVSALLDACRAEGLHTAVDTAGSVPLSVSAEVISKSDMLLLDIKSLDDELCRAMTGQGNRNTLETLRFCEESGKPVWIRHVVVPGWTDDAEEQRRLGYFIGGLKTLKALDVLPYHDMGKSKYEALGMDYPLKDVQPLPAEDAQRARAEIMKGIKKRLREQN